MGAEFSGLHAEAPSAAERQGVFGGAAPSLEAVAEFIRSGRAHRVVLMTGAGTSVSAGIPDFRSAGVGLYAQLAELGLPTPEAVFHIDFFRANPVPFYRLARQLMPGDFHPTPAHFFAVLMHRKGLLLRQYTQNIDNLELLAGLPPDKLVEAHGSFADVHCIRCGKQYSVDWFKKHLMAGDGIVPRCRGKAVGGEAGGEAGGEDGGEAVGGGGGSSRAGGDETGGDNAAGGTAGSSSSASAGTDGSLGGVPGAPAAAAVRGREAQPADRVAGAVGSAEGASTSGDRDATGRRRNGTGVAGGSQAGARSQGGSPPSERELRGGGAGASDEGNRGGLAASGEAAASGASGEAAASGASGEAAASGASGEAAASGASGEAAASGGSAPGGGLAGSPSSSSSELSPHSDSADSDGCDIPRVGGSQRTGRSGSLDLAEVAEAFGAAEGPAAASGRCNGLIKPDITFFGEPLPKRFKALCQLDLQSADLLIVMGTSLQVYPFAGLIHLAPPLCPRLLINREPVALSFAEGGADGNFLFHLPEENYRDAFEPGDCDDAVRRLCRCLGWEAELDALIDDYRRQPRESVWQRITRSQIMTAPTAE